MKEEFNQYKGKQLCFAEQILFDFFLELQSAWRELDADVLLDISMRNLLSSQHLAIFSDLINGFKASYYEAFIPHRDIPPEQPLPPSKDIRNKLIKPLLKKILVKIGLFNLAKANVSEGKKILLSISQFFKREPDVDTQDTAQTASLPKRKETGFDNTDIISIFRTSTKQQLRDFAKSIICKNRNAIAKVYNDIHLFNDHPSNKKCLIISGAIAPTLAPTFRELARAGYHLGFVVQELIDDAEGYGCMTRKDYTMGQCFEHKMLGTMIFAANVASNQPVMISGELYHFVDFYADRCVRLNLTISCMLNAIKKNRPLDHKNLGLLMYDGLKPVSKNCAQMKNEMSKYYERLLKAPDKLWFNSNSEHFGEFLESTYGKIPPRIHFLRYSETIEDLSKKRDFGPNGDEFHIVTISIAFGQEVSRDSTPDMLRTILEQGIHVHTYTGEPQVHIDRFLETVDPKYRNFLHVHKVNRNQEELVKEIHQYHAGFNGSDHVMFAEGIVTTTDRKYKDGIFMYMLSTYPTSTLVYAASGVPLLPPRFMAYGTGYFGECAIPVCCSELKHLKQRFERAKLKELCKDYKSFQHKGRARAQIHKLIDFFEINVTSESTSTSNTLEHSF